MNQVQASSTSPVADSPPQASQTSSNVLPMILVGLFMLMLGAIGGYYLGMQNAPKSPLPDNIESTPVPTPEGVMCTLEALECPDGSYVGRTGPNCEFAECPTE